MPNYSTDTGLRILAKSLSTVRWSTALTVDEQNRVVQASGRNIAVMPDGFTHVVRIYLAGAIQTLGVTRNPAAAFRFADLALARFWKYRLRNCRPPGPGELNFSTARLQSDLANESEACGLLDKLEQYLIANAGLTERTAVTPRPSRSRVAELTAALAQANRRIDELSKYLQNRADGIDGRLDDIALRIIALENRPIVRSDEKPAGVIPAGVAPIEVSC